MDYKRKKKIIHGIPLCREVSKKEFGSISFMNKDYKTPKEADPKLLWAHLKTKYRDGDEFIDEEFNIWDVWKKNGGFVLYCSTSKEVVEVPKPKRLGG